MGKRFPLTKRPLARGVCRFCQCSHFDPCPDGCAWLDRAQTVCTECAPALKAEREARRLFAYQGAQLEAFRLGFVVGWFRLRGARAKNPYAGVAHLRSIRNAYAWNRGRDQGRHARTSHGPVLNTPVARRHERALERAMA
jgi:hypothetical protein